MAKAIWKTRLLKVPFYAMFVFLSIFIVLVLRLSSLIWIHDVGMIGRTSLEVFKWELRNLIFISAIQTPIMLSIALVYFFIKRNLYLQHITVVTLLICILDLFIRPIGIWTMYYQVLGPTLTIGAIIIFPLFAWLILFLPFPDRNLENKYIQKIIPRRMKNPATETDPQLKEITNQ